MYGYLCEKCGCTLDPGEGRLCDDCRKKRDQKKSRMDAVERMVRATEYKQMGLEEFLNG